jgi:hypothetical protein
VAAFSVQDSLAQPEGIFTFTLVQIAGYGLPRSCLFHALRWIRARRRDGGQEGPHPSIVKRLIAYHLPASAAHTAKPSARLSALKASGSPAVGVSCEFMDTVAERLPVELAAMNWV